MRAALYYDRKDIRVEDVEEDTVGPGQVRIEVDSCGICGSDLHEYTAGPIFVPRDEPHPLSQETAPIRMGHEYSGVITDVGESVTDLEAGDAVAINPILSCGECRQCREGNYHICDSIGFLGLSGGNGGFAQSVVVDEHHAVPLGDDVPVEYGALVEPLSVGLHAVRRSGLQAGDSVAVFGSGPIGLAVIQAARAAGAGTIYVSEPRQARRERAADCGADVLVDPSSTNAVEYITSNTDGGVDVSFEVAGVEASFNDAVQSTRPSGTTTVVSIWEEEASTHLNNVVLGERTVTGTLAYLGGPRSDEEYGMVIEMLGDGRLDPDPFITDRIGLDELVEEGFDRLIDPASDHVKILVKPNE
ncbi:alcohol dehydrogenase catalytic domain-containing protein [Haloferax sp. MBLA0076]|uniref:Alcohol dehydrogenase catalytic domain-containing protein n=1 Tax=Haloferax litoreum TaxID=2666140 RepID=A0A6A8GM05_9EURY|nr:MULTISPECIES: 2,3-butanediol dehydrogenase [Haloferax]KAB1190591.1 2,3-butanediol dehydrogenase [Haloferax sp. CBA1148]MRX23582.1 alcohol dehydrogenase catalytic domain-containing protein [Haloferax litoreum]